LQVCPLCNKEYNDIAKTCPLDHCKNCGSLELQKTRFRSLTKYGKANHSVFTGTVGFITGVGSLYLYSKYNEWFYALIAGIITVGSSYLFYRKYSFKDYSCNSCKARKFQPVTDIYLRKVRKATDVRKEDTIESVNTRTNMLDEIINAKTEHEKRNFKVGLINLIVGVIGILIGIAVTYFYA